MGAMLRTGVSGTPGPTPPTIRRVCVCVRVSVCLCPCVGVCAAVPGATRCHQEPALRSPRGWDLEHPRLRVTRGRSGWGGIGSTRGAGSPK